MRKIANIKFGLGQSFYDWLGRYEQFPLVRFYMGSRGIYYNLFLLLSVFDESGKAQKGVEAIIDRVRGLLTAANVKVEQDRETVFGIANAVDHLRYTLVSAPFEMNNYLDAIGPRTHVVLYGGGTFTNLDTGAMFDFGLGDVILFDNDDFGQRFNIHIEGKTTHHLITCWASEASAEKNWKLFAKFQRSIGQRGFRE